MRVNMDNSVVIKGSRNGIIVVLDGQVEFGILKDMVAKKFADSAKFLGNCKTAVRFEGRDLTRDEELALLDVIGANSDLEVVCILSEDPQQNSSFTQAVNKSLMEEAGHTATFYKGNLRSGQQLECDNSIIYVGDINPGAAISSNGNIIVLGALKGNAAAGASGNRDAFVFALDMNPMQIRIADTIARAPDNPDKNTTRESKIAFLEDENIYIEPVTKSILNDLRIG